MNKPCAHVMTATDVSIEEDGERRAWAKLEAFCRLEHGHAGAHSYGPWIDPETGKPAWVSDQSSALPKDGNG